MSEKKSAMSLGSDVAWLEEKFVDCSVALALTLINESKENVLSHVETCFVDGCGDPFYNVPSTILPKVRHAISSSLNPALLPLTHLARCGIIYSDG